MYTPGKSGGHDHPSPLCGDAPGYNSAESKPIWIKSGTLWGKCRGIAPADFGRNPRSSDSLRGSRSFVFLSCKQRTISPISRRTKFTTSEHNNVDRWGGKNFRNRIWKIFTTRGRFYEKNAKIAHKMSIHLTVDFNFGKCIDRSTKFFHQQIPEKISMNCYRVFHLTLTMLLHYLGKFKNKT